MDRYDPTIDYETIRWIKNYEVPETNRPLYMLLNTNSIWQMSRIERKKLHDYWRDKIHEKFIERLSKLKYKHDQKREELNKLYDEGRRQTLKNCDVIGMTTNGAAKFQNLIRSIGPKIIVCEEAGEVLEAHILSALTPATQHIILIGDPNQLRPRIATYSLSMESKEGKNYQLDKSLFERLVSGDKAAKIGKVQLLTQRRMRKNEISDLVRYTLYPDLIDGENTAKYSNIRGSKHNVYFIDHKFPEDDTGGDFATQSHVNQYEVKMVVEMVKYFVRNGYTKPEDIAVLTPYLGQMMKIKEALDESFVVVIDERDAQSLAEMEQDDGKVDNNGKGEEANIVIISLVRNYAGFGKRDTIGFLKSKNRSNVLLSRAREGMYLIGNSKLMAAQSKNMWTLVINMLQSRDPPQIGFGFPIVCNKHPNYKNIIDDPEQFAKVSPDGGCLKRCRILLPCGHRCTYKCHSDDPEHIGIQCLNPCKRLRETCNHPCPRLCFESCGNCNVPIDDIILTGCGHTVKNATCWQNHNKDIVKCMTYVLKRFPICGHSKVIHCYESIDDVRCESLCGKSLECNHKCLNECFKCQELSKSQDNPPSNEQNI
ncbi:10547_t:CDS:2 [Funneliformis mosseae]|uniref:10547_t:CDS:1 n=1 Tax=Funneliformis mosseae TaxID=27381 RepID=A0A9N9HIP2_FUNMO|nr:10547_t:CDS:2 [Funneliformis mosseae]